MVQPPKAYETVLLQVIMTDRLWHCSGPNNSLHFRRAWMPQYSEEPILDSISGEPVALAVPVMPECPEQLR